MISRRTRRLNDNPAHRADASREPEWISGFRRKWGRCERCKLHKGSRIWGEGKADAKIAIATFAPTLDTAVIGKPINPSEREYLEFLLEQIGLSLDDVWLTHLALCSGPSPLPRSDCIAACADRLAEELKHVGARVLVVLGDSGRLPHLGDSPYHHGLFPTLWALGLNATMTIPIFFLQRPREVIKAHPHCPHTFSPLNIAIRTLSHAQAYTHISERDAAQLCDRANERVWTEAHEQFAKQFVGRHKQRTPYHYQGVPLRDRGLTRLRELGLRTGESDLLERATVQDLTKKVRDTFFGRGGTYRMKRPPDDPGWITKAQIDAENLRHAAATREPVQPEWTWEGVSQQQMAAHFDRELVLSSFAPREVITMALDPDRHSELQKAFFEERDITKSCGSELDESGVPFRCHATESGWQAGERHADAQGNRWGALEASHVEGRRDRGEDCRGHVG